MLILPQWKCGLPVLNDDPHDEEAQEQFAYWYEVVYKNRATPYNSDYDAETFEAEGMTIEESENHINELPPLERKLVRIWDGDFELGTTRGYYHEIIAEYGVRGLNLPTWNDNPNHPSSPPNREGGDGKGFWDSSYNEWRDSMVKNDPRFKSLPLSQVPLPKNAETFEAETLHEKGDYRIIAENDYDFWDERWTDSSKEMAEEYGVYTLKVQKKVMGGWETIDSLSGVIAPDYGADSLKDFALKDMEIPEGVVFESPYGGAGSLMDIGKATPLADFTDEELATSSAIHGDFDQASLNYSGHQNLEVRAEEVSGDITFTARQFVDKLHDVDVKMYEDALDTVAWEGYGRVGTWSDDGLGNMILHEDESMSAEMEIIDESNARIKNRFGDEIGMVGVDDHDVEDAVVEVSDGSDVIQEVIISEAETKKSSMLPLAIGMIAGVLAFPESHRVLYQKRRKSG